MSASLNKVFLIGNLTRDPEVRRTPTGVPVAKLGLAVSESFRTKGGSDEERTCFVDVDVWDKQAEACEQYLSKGRPILVEGRLQMDQWTSREGEKRSKLKIRADRIQFLGSPRRDAAMGDAPGSAPMASGHAEPEPYEEPLSHNEDDEIPF